MWNAYSFGINGNGPERTGCDRQRVGSGSITTHYGVFVAIGPWDDGLPDPTKFVLVGYSCSKQGINMFSEFYIMYQALFVTERLVWGKLVFEFWEWRFDMARQCNVQEGTRANPSRLHRCRHDISACTLGTFVQLALRSCQCAVGSCQCAVVAPVLMMLAEQCRVFHLSLCVSNWGGDLGEFITGWLVMRHYLLKKKRVTNDCIAHKC